MAIVTGTHGRIINRECAAFGVHMNQLFTRKAFGLGSKNQISDIGNRFILPQSEIDLTGAVVQSNRPGLFKIIGRKVLLACEFEDRVFEICIREDRIASDKSSVGDDSLDFPLTIFGYDLKL